MGMQGDAQPLEQLLDILGATDEELVDVLRFGITIPTRFRPGRLTMLPCLTARRYKYTWRGFSQSLVKRVRRSILDASLPLEGADHAGLHTVLAVEDEPSVRELVANFLRDEGYEVEEAQDGAGAIRALDQHRPPSGHLGVVLLDMRLPDGDGMRVLRHLSALGAHVPVVALSASPERLAAVVAAGAQATV